MSRIPLPILAAALCSILPPASASPSLSQSIDIADVVSDFRVEFSLLTAGDLQYAAYYDSERRMTVASRRLDSTAWNYQILPSKVGVDSHNYVTMAVDADGHLHVSGNMHCVPLLYFRTTTVGDIATLEAAVMTGNREQKVTYPRFLTDHLGRLLFTYRDGGSGNGVNLFNRYDTTSRTWTRLMDEPLFDGEGARNAYPSAPVCGPDGWFHIHWVWRDTPCCATNHHLSHARSRDLFHWESAFGKPVALPIRIAHRELLVDAIPSNGGIINGGHHLHLDQQGAPVIVYHKNDTAGHMQIFAARPDNGTWQIRQLTKWNETVPFSGGGSMGFIGIRISLLPSPAPGLLAIGYRHKDHGTGHLVLNESTLDPIANPPPVPRDLPPALDRLESAFPGMEIQRAHDLGTPPDPNTRYLLQWESLGPNRDRPREGPLPPPSKLRLHRITAPE